MPNVLPVHLDDTITPGSSVLLPYAIISVEGPDAEKFLQGQLSCDVAALALDEVTYGTANTPKGRMVALFKLCRQKDRFLIRLHQDCAAHFVQHLSKYQVFFKCSVSIRDDYCVLGMLGHSDNGSDETGAPHLLKSALSDDLGLTELWCEQSQAPQSPRPEWVNYWHCIETLLGLPELYPATLEQFILQYLNLQHLNAVSFKKGCYTGQEIIARMKYLGKQKKEMVLFRSQQPVQASPGESMRDTNSAKLGELVRIHYHKSLGTVALAVVSSELSVGPHAVTLGSSENITFDIKKLEYS